MGAGYSERDPVLRAARRVQGHRSLLALVVLLFAASAFSGCLFPPVTTAGDVPTPREGGSPIINEGAPVFVQQSFQRSDRGEVSAGATVATGVEEGTQAHIFDLPPRVISLRIELEWDHGTYDLDVAAELRRDAPNGTQLAWAEQNREGDVGAPDSPAVLATTDRSMITFEDNGVLRVTVHAKAGVDLPYTLSVRALHLVPAS